jgi:hypothetical protein
VVVNSRAIPRAVKVTSALANDGGVLRALLTAVMMVLPFAVIAGLAATGRVLWRRRHHSQTPPTD